MPWMAIAAPIVGSAVSGYFSSRSADKATQAQTQAADQAIAEQRRQYDQTRADQSPFQATGVAANQRLAYLLGLGGYGPYNQGVGAPGTTGSGVGQPGMAPDGYPAAADATGMPDARWVPGAARGVGAYGTSGDPYNAGFLTRRFTAGDLNADPVYQSGLQFGLDQGTGAINSRAIAGGGYDSGATIKALTRYANDYGSTKANESYNRFSADQGNIFNRLSGVSGGGQTATNQVTAAGQNMANNVSNLNTSAGSARSAGIVAGNAAWNPLISATTDAARGWKPGGVGTATPGSTYAGYDPNNYGMGQNLPYPSY